MSDTLIVPPATPGPRGVAEIHDRAAVWAVAIIGLVAMATAWLGAGVAPDAPWRGAVRRSTAVAAALGTTLVVYWARSRVASVPSGLCAAVALSALSFVTFRSLAPDQSVLGWIMCILLSLLVGWGFFEFRMTMPAGRASLNFIAMGAGAFVAALFYSRNWVPANNFAPVSPGEAGLVGGLTSAGAIALLPLAEVGRTRALRLRAIACWFLACLSYVFFYKAPQYVYNNASQSAGAGVVTMLFFVAICLVCLVQMCVNFAELQDPSSELFRGMVGFSSMVASQIFFVASLGLGWAAGLLQNISVTSAAPGTPTRTAAQDSYTVTAWIAFALFSGIWSSLSRGAAQQLSEERLEARLDGIERSVRHLQREQGLFTDDAR